jgi:hypothetical protein
MSQLVRHFGDVKDALRPCGICDVCDPAGAELRQFRHATPSERIIVQAIVDELRPVNYIAAGTLQRKLELTGEMSRDDFDALLGAMVRAGLIEIEEAEFEKNGEVLRFRKVMLTDAGLDVRATTPLELLIADGIVEEFGSSAAEPKNTQVHSAKTGSRGGASAATDARIRGSRSAAPRVAHGRSEAAGLPGVPGAA